jgi:membrane protein
VARPWSRFLAACAAAYRDNCLGIAKGAAYSSLLAFFPVLTAIAAILVQTDAAAVSRTLSGMLFEAVPPGTEGLLLQNFIERGPRPLSLLIGATLVAAWAASGVMMSLMEGFRAAYRIPAGRSMVAQRGMAVFLVFASAVPAVAASAAIVFGRRTERVVLGWLGWIPAGEQWRGGVRIAGSLSRYLIALATIVLVTGALYYFGPNRPRKRWREVWPGAIVATVLWLAATSVFGWYVTNVATYNVLYGGIGAVVTFLVWTYVLAVIALLGCEFNAQRRVDSKPQTPARE